MQKEGGPPWLLLPRPSHESKDGANGAYFFFERNNLKKILKKEQKCIFFTLPNMDSQEVTHP
jgi:hypothetical protein